jgi:hypothetical protein
MENVMEIREDFKVDFDSWKKEAKVLCRKSVFFIFIFSFLIPFGAYYGLEALQISTPNLKMIHYPLASAVLWFLSMFSAFYTFFYFKRVDFEEPKNILNVFKDVIYTYKNFLEYVKIHIIFFYVIAVLTVLSFFLGFAAITPYEPKSYLNILSSSLIGSYISYYMLMTSSNSYIFGVIYIGYGMVNKEGAGILTTNAFNKYPELQEYVSKTAFILSNAYLLGWVGFIFSSNHIVKTAVLSLFIIISIYYSAIYYLISRDLYGGKKQTQKVNEKVEDINAMPTPI